MLTRGRGCHGGCEEPDFGPSPTAYAYLLGLYLGDGTLVDTKRRHVHRLELFQDQQYVLLIHRAMRTMETVLPTSRVGLRPMPGCVCISSYGQHWPCLLPQHGPGRKCDRDIRLAGWQETVVAADPRPFVAGLIHSDGSRHVNTVTNGKSGKRYSYVRYEFTQRSDDIRELFTWACDLLGVRWTQTHWNRVAVSRRADGEALDTFVGPKS